MKKITETLSKEVVAVAEGEIVGIVTNVYADGRLRRVRGYKVSSEDRDAGRSLPLRRVIGEREALVVRDAAVLTESTVAECPLGVKVFDTVGAFHGILRDLIFDERTGSVHSLVADEREIAADRVVASGKSAVILRAEAHDGMLFRKRAIRSKSKRTSPAPERGEALPPADVALAPLAEAENEREPLAGEYAFLLGRSVLKDILSDGDALARAGERVTPDLISRAREKGKLVELTVNSRKE